MQGQSPRGPSKLTWKSARASLDGRRTISVAIKIAYDNPILYVFPGQATPGRAAPDTFRVHIFLQVYSDLQVFRSVYRRYYFWLLSHLHIFGHASSRYASAQLYLPAKLTET